MARKKRGRKKAAQTRKRNQKKDNKPLLSRSASREISAVLLIMIAVFLILAMLNLTGQLGTWVLSD